MYTGLAHTGVGAAFLTVAAIGTTISGYITRRATRRALRRNQQDGGDQ
ncbi:hypothetical protein [Streptomyces sp. NPDC005799]